jgi:L-threonylcarbamoyladenylate synthase
MSIISNCAASVIKNAAKSLVGGNLVAFPTETVYGLGADATNENAVARIYGVKGRPIGHPLIVHISSIKHLEKWARDVPEYAIQLARIFWPGPMTLILPRTPLAKDFITGGQDNVAIRVPSNTIALALLNEFESLGGLGVAAPSANRFGKVSPTSAQAVSEELSNYLTSTDLILDGGSCVVGVESSIINCTQDTPAILRPGAITTEMIYKKISILVKQSNEDKGEFKIKASGLLQSHYAPAAKVFLSINTQPGDGFIAYSSISTPTGTVRLASPKNNDEYANQLYQALRLADSKQLQRVVVIPPTNEGIGVAINDRLAKAVYL